ncbi:MAG: LEA type 2 family protein [Xanthomonadaceae bacterium]|jgi:hypothetical protein|nr:LEA type 2 family protein [Xanthomonadaceae bacterium]
MKRYRYPVATLMLGLLLAACGGPVKRVSTPTVSIQQLTVHANGGWSVDLRLQNYSSISMNFDTVAIDMKIGDQEAGTLQGSPRISIGPTSADVVTLQMQPSSPARIAVADALAGRRGVSYQLSGKLTAIPEEQKPREFEVQSRSLLNPAPGLAGVLR